MTKNKHKVFISYHHANDEFYKNALLDINANHELFIDASVDTADIGDDLADERVREIIRDDYLRDSTVTIVLVGTETKERKHVDWEIYSSMYDGKINKKSGVLVITLPDTGCSYYNAAHGDDEKQKLYPYEMDWISIENRTDYESRYPFLPDRIIDNLLKDGVKVSVTNWEKVTADVEKLRYLIDVTFNDRAACDYDLTRAMRMSNS